MESNLTSIQDRHPKWPVRPFLPLLILVIIIPSLLITVPYIFVGNPLPDEVLPPPTNHQVLSSGLLVLVLDVKN